MPGGRLLGGDLREDSGSISVGFIYDPGSLSGREGFRPRRPVKAPALQELALGAAGIGDRHDELSAIPSGDRHREHETGIGRPGRDDDRQ